MRQETNTGDIIKKFRVGYKMKLIVLASHLGVSENYIYMVERGLRVPSLKFILAFAKLFRINPEWLFEKWIRDRMIREELKVRQQFQEMISKKFSDLKLPSLPSPERLDKRSGRALREGWSGPLRKIPIRYAKFA